MLRTVKRLHRCKVHALDGEIGTVEQVYFDDEAWGIRYLVVETGTWLNERRVLLSPYAVLPSPAASDRVQVRLTRQQVRDSPNIDTHKPVSRQHELDYLRYYNYPTYWGGPNLWGMGAWPAFDAPDAEPGSTARFNGPIAPEGSVPSDATDVHLRSTNEVKGYRLETIDGKFGHVSDFVYDDRAWALRYLVADKRNWWSGGKQVLVGVHWVELVDWAGSTVTVMLTRDAIRQYPAYDVSVPVPHSYEAALREYYGREDYWSRTGAWTATAHARHQG